MNDVGAEVINRRLILLGCAGSIGQNTVEVIEHLHRNTPHRFDVVGLATGSNAKVLSDHARRLNVPALAMADPVAGSQLEAAHVFTGPDASLKLIEAIARPGDLVVGAMVGSAGIPATLAAVERGCDIALANKETLVAAGSIVTGAVERRGVSLLPIDSEHSAIFQCLAGGRSTDEIRRLVITASGGPFRTWSADRIEHATIEEALAHPTWSMGRKISIDSATLMNKALEIIEAHWLFGMERERIDAIVHPQSMVHSFVEFIDGSVLAQLGPPDMRSPIQYALTWPQRAASAARSMNWSELSTLTFEPVDQGRFGAIGLAGDVIERGGTAGAIFNAANEVAVEAFLDGRIGFGSITRLVGETLSRIPVSTADTLESVLEADQAARGYVAEQLARPDVTISAGPGCSTGR